MKKLYKEVPKERGAMEEFLREHTRYYTPWNKRHTYANCVKLYKRNLSYEIRDIDAIIYPIIKDWTSVNKKYRVFFNVRNNGYMVLIKENTSEGIDENGNFDKMNDEELTSRVKLVQSFDKLCDYCIETLVDTCRS